MEAVKNGAVLHFVWDQGRFKHCIWGIAAINDFMKHECYV